MYSLFLIAPLLFASLPPDDGAAQENELRLYDVSTLRMHYDESNLEEFGVRLTPYRTRDLLEYSDSYDEDARGSEVFVDLLIEVLGEEFEYEGRRVSIADDGRLAVIGPASLHERVDAILSFFEKAAFAEVRLQMDLLTMPAGTADALRAVITPAEAQALVDRARTQRSFQVSARGDQPATIDLAEDAPAVLDYDVEIAQGSAIYDPVSYNVTTGTRAWIQAAPAVGGTHLALLMQRGERLPMRQLDLDLEFYAGMVEKGISVVEGVRYLPVVDVAGSGAAITTYLPDDGVLVLRSKVDVAKGRLDEVVLLRKVGGGLPLRSEIELQPGGARLILADRGAHAPTRTSLNGALHAPRLNIDIFSRHWNSEPAMLARFASDSGDFLFELLDMDREYSDIDFLGPWLVSRAYGGLRGENGAQVRAEQDAVVDALAKARVAGDLLELTFSVRQGEGSNPILARVPVQAGSSTSLALGVEGPDVVGYDVEVAQMSSVADPIVHLAMDGAMLWARATPRPDGRLLLEVRGGASLELSDELVPLGSRTAPVYQSVTSNHVIVDERRLLEERNGAWSMTLGDTGRDSELSIEVTVRRL